MADLAKVYSALYGEGLINLNLPLFFVQEVLLFPAMKPQDEPSSKER